MKHFFLKLFLATNLFAALLLTACKKNEDIKHIFFDKKLMSNKDWCIEGINEVKKGDILLIANGNYALETTELNEGIFFGHTALVTKGYKHNNIDSLLSNITIIELSGLSIHPKFQLREIRGLVNHKFAGLRSDSFRSKRQGIRYRLRLNIPEEQIDQIVDFARSQLGEDYSWNAMKKFKNEAITDDSNPYAWADHSVWNCSLLIWQAVYCVTGLDIDCNKGFFVYPNDIIAHSTFDNIGEHIGRARF